MLDSVVKVKKKYYPQTVLEECKYEIKKKTKMENLINDELELNSSDNATESDNESDNEPTINCIKFWDFLMFYQAFLLPQVKQCTIITYKHGIYKLPHELPNDLGL